MKPSYALLLLALCTVISLTQSKAEDVPASSGPSCEFGDLRNLSHQRAEVLAAAAVRFKSLCMESGSILVHIGDARLTQNITVPGQIHGPGPDEFYPPGERARRAHGTIYVSYVVEKDGQATSPAVLLSSGNRALDDAALKFVASLSFASPAYLDSMPARFYTFMRVAF